MGTVLNFYYVSSQLCFQLRLQRSPIKQVPSSLLLLFPSCITIPLLLSHISSISFFTSNSCNNQSQSLRAPDLLYPPGTTF